VSKQTRLGQPIGRGQQFQGRLAIAWIRTLEEKGTWAPFWLGLGIFLGYLVVRGAFDGLFLVSWGFPVGTDPLWRSDSFWTELVNAALLGYIPAVLLMAHRGVSRDLIQLRPRLVGSDADVADIRRAATRSSGVVARVCQGLGFLGGFYLVLHDPSLSLGSESTLTNPAFMWPLVRTPIFGWVLVTLVVSDLNGTLAYWRLGRDHIEVDLLDLQSLTPFARRGLRSALTWVVFSMVFSLFWIGDHASHVNPFVFIAVLTMATVAFAMPLIGVHTNIRTVKRLELERLRGEIRVERAGVLNELSVDTDNSPKLANLIAYFQLIDRTREWPIDAVNVLRFFMYLLIGLGSWLGGAVVERLLDRTLSG
jgi:hypothetical protein